MRILQQARYWTVEYNFIIECDVCIGRISIFMIFDRSTDADVGWYVNNLTYNAGEPSGLLSAELFPRNFFPNL